MSDIITMQGPSCGGKLAVGRNALSLKCEHCGSEHMILREAGGIVLESYARCPICNRNDKAEMVTAILRSQTHNVQGRIDSEPDGQCEGGKYLPTGRPAGSRAHANPAETRTLEELLEIIEAKGQEVAEALAVLRNARR